MDFSQAKGNLGLYKGVSLLFAIVFGLNAVIQLCPSDNTAVAANEQLVGLGDKVTYYGPLLGELAIGLVAAILFWWLHSRVRRVTANELSLQILVEPVRFIAWSEVLSAKKALPNLLNGFYLFNLTDGTIFYTPIERDSPTFSTLSTWYEAPTSLEQLCIKKGVWIQ